MKNKFKYILINKILPILSIFLLCINIFVVYSFGNNYEVIKNDDGSFSFDGKNYNFNDSVKSFNYYAIFDTNVISPYGSSRSFILFCSNSLITAEKSGKGLIFHGSDFAYVVSTFSGVMEESFSNNSYFTDILDFSTDNFSNGSFVYSNFDFKYTDGTIVHPSDNQPKFENPCFLTTKEELESGKFDLLKIDAGSLDYADDKFVLNIYDVYDLDSNITNNYIKKSFLLDVKSSYLYVANLNLYYHIPRDKLGIDISNFKKYCFELKEKNSDKIYSSVTFTISGLTFEEEINNKQDEQTNAIKENTETNKRNI